MKKIIVQAIAIPSTSLARQLLPGIDFADAFKCQVPEEQLQNIDSVTRAIFLTLPQWIAALLALRNAIVHPFGLKTSIDAAPSSSRDELQPGTAVGAFEVLERRLDELLLGEDDQHLDYRVSVRLEREEGSCWVVVSTVVKFNNWFGRTYFVLVRPVHKIIVPAMIRYGLASAISNVSSAAA